MFLGEYQHHLDEKNRIAIPTKFRPKLKTGAIITRGLDTCLFLYPKATWQVWAEKLATLPISQAKSRSFVRMMLGGAMEVSIDGQGRIIIPDYLKEYASLKKQIVVTGLYDRIELWDRQEWDRYKSQAERDSNQVAETLASLGV